jgi:hypothetical protein
MCFFKVAAPKITPPPPPAQLQAAQAPKDMMQDPRDGSLRIRRRGMWASVFTGPAGLASAPVVTGTGGGLTGG